MTKVIILKEQTIQVANLKPIEFVKCVRLGTIDCVSNSDQPPQWETVELISKSYSVDDGTKYDIMFAYDGSRENIKNSGLYLGYFNDGVV